MVWASIWERFGEAGKTPLAFCDGDPDSPRGGFNSKAYIQVLEETLLPFYEAGDPFMQDNVRIHRSKAVRFFLESHGIWTIPWPPHSPDLNPIEHVWRMLKAKIYELEPHFATYKDNIVDQAAAKELIQLAWSELDHEAIRKLLLSIPRRLSAVGKARGWYSHY